VLHPPSGADGVPLRDVVGLVANLASSGFMKVFNGRHWIAIRNIDGTFYNLDSHLAEPRAFASEAALRAFLSEEVLAADGQLFLVMKPQAAVRPATAAGDKSSS